MGWKDTAEPLLTRMPSVRRPEGHVPFKRKLLWTAGVLVLYFYLTNVTLLGLGTGGQDFFGQFRSILAGSFGSVLTVGIGPIVTASIVLQLLGGADLLGLDTNDPRDQILYQGLQKLLVVVMTALTAFPMVFAGGVSSGALPATAVSLGGLSLAGSSVQWLIFGQIFVGGILILFMDEIISKWGVGSGIGLFIIAGVSQRLIGGMFAWEGLGGQIGLIPTWIGIATGEIDIAGVANLFLDPGGLLAIITTVLIFVIVVYAESVRVEIPLSHARVKGARGRFPVKLIYASVLPMILVRALQANIQFLGRIMSSQLGSLPAWLGVYDSQGQPVSGLLYYMAPIQTRAEWTWFLGTTSADPVDIMIRIAVDLGFMVIGGGIFAVFWVETTGMGPRDTAKQIHNSGMQIPGFRQNVGVVEQVLERYIPQVAVLGGMIVGVLAVAANMLGTIGGVSGTGLLLTVSITYKIYEEIAEEQLMEMHPMMRQMFG
jgi:preprotein translocase subunit SecY